MSKYIIKIFPNILRNIPIIDRWLLGQLFPPLIFAISAFTVVSLSVGVMIDLIRKIVEYGLPFQLALQIMFLKLPSFLVLSFPMSVLLSTLLAYSKLSSNSEILALRSLGIKTSRIIIPALVLSIFMTGLTFYFNKYWFRQLEWFFYKIISIFKIHILNKIRSFSHGEFNDEKINENTIKEKILNNVDIFNRGFRLKKIEMDSTYPEYILKNKEKYSKWII